MEIAAYVIGVIFAVLALAVTVIGVKGHAYVALWLGCLAGDLALIGCACWVHDYWSKADARERAGRLGHGIAPMKVMATTRKVAIPDGSVIVGISWLAAYRELKMIILNESDAIYRDIDFVIRPDQAVAAVGRATDVADVSITWHEMPECPMEAVNPISGQRTAIPLVPLASKRGVRVLCGALAGKSRLELVIAAVALNKPAGPKPEVDRVSSQ